MISKRFLVLVVFLALMVLAACQGQSNRTSAAPPATAAIPATGRSTAAVPPVPPVDATLTPEMETLVSAARQKLADKFQRPAADFHLFSITPATWPDSSLGCPQSGVVYQPVVTPGFQMVFEGGNSSYVVHSDENAVVVICAARPPGEIYQPP